MIKENVLDSESSENDANYVFDSISWWENKRGIYNLNLIGFEIIMMSFYWKGTMEFGIGNLIYEAIAYTIVANICYSFGWGITVLSYYYNLKFLQKIIAFRMLFFVGGILYSIFLTMVLFKDALSNF